MHGTAPGNLFILRRTLTTVQLGFKAPGSHVRVVADRAREVLCRASRGALRTAENLLRAAMGVAHHKNRDFVDEYIMLVVCDKLDLIKPHQERGRASPSTSSNPRK